MSNHMLITFSVDSDVYDLAAIILLGETFQKHILLDVVSVEKHTKA